ncbi:MAG: hypothetical protein ABSF09_13635 [Candidatus Bathyarchaeia archaeon]
MQKLYSKSHLTKIGHDRRGLIFRASLVDREYSFVEMRETSLRGGHYHSRETFHLVVQGRIRFELMDPILRRKRQVTAGPMDIVRVRAGVAHLLIALEDSIFIEPLAGHGTTVNFNPQRARVVHFIRSSE